MKTKIYKSYSQFLKRKDKTVNGVSPEFAENYPNYSDMNVTNKGCWNCRYCSDCSSCIDCIDCRDKKYELKIPKIDNIHSKILEVTSKTGALDMDVWHSECGTAHCRAGWVVSLAGKQGLELEKQLGTPLAAAKIYSESSDIKVHWALRFYENNEEAMKDIKRCAELEKQQ